MKRLLSLVLMTLMSTAAYAEELETLLGYSFDLDGLHLQVASGGCTYDEDFRMTVAETSPVQVRFYRTKPDRCELFVPFGKLVTIPWDKLPEGEFYLYNPVENLLRNQY